MRHSDQELEKQAREQGYSCYLEGGTLAMNPHRSTLERDAWINGWFEARDHCPGMQGNQQTGSGHADRIR